MHFTVLVVGDNYDESLAPFNENPDEDDEACAEHIDWNCEGTDGKNYSAETKEELEKALEESGTTMASGPWFSNGQGYWDWYALGGRWQGMLQLKKDSTSGQKGRPGVFDKQDTNPLRADSALIKDIDFEGMYSEAIKNAEILYDKVMNIFGELPVHTSYAELCKKHKNLNRKDVHNIYNQQPRLIALATVRETEPTFFIDADDFLISKEEYVENAKFNRLRTYALIDADGNWHSEDQLSDSEFNELFKSTLESLSPDTRISIVDCHV